MIVTILCYFTNGTDRDHYCPGLFVLVLEILNRDTRQAERIVGVMIKKET